MSGHRKRVSIVVEAHRKIIAYRNKWNVSYTEALNSLLLNSDLTNAPTGGTYSENEDDYNI